MGKNLTPNDHETILQEEYKIDIKNKNSLEEIRIKAHEDFIWIFLKQGTAKPRSEEVYKGTSVNSMLEKEYSSRELFSVS